MINNFLELFKNIEGKVRKIIKFSFGLSLIIGLISSLLIATYNTYPSSLDLYYSSLLLFQAGIVLASSTFVIGTIFNTMNSMKVSK